MHDGKWPRVVMAGEPDGRARCEPDGGRDRHRRHDSLARPCAGEVPRRRLRARGHRQNRFFVSCNYLKWKPPSTKSTFAFVREQRGGCPLEVMGQDDGAAARDRRAATYQGRLPRERAHLRLGGLLGLEQGLLSRCRLTTDDAQIAAFPRQRRGLDAAACFPQRRYGRWSPWPTYRSGIHRRRPSKKRPARGHRAPCPPCVVRRLAAFFARVEGATRREGRLGVVGGPPARGTRLRAAGAPPLGRRRSVDGTIC